MMKWLLAFFLLISPSQAGINNPGTQVAANILANGSTQFWFNGSPTIGVKGASPQFWLNGPNEGPVQ